MNRRVRFLHKPPTNRVEPFYKFLKPGALAQMRDSRIIARSHRVNSHAQIFLHRRSSLPLSPLSSSGQPQIDLIDDFPFLASRVYTPLCLNRKKLAAIKSMGFVSPTLPSPTSDLTRDPILDVLNSEVAAH